MNDLIGKEVQIYPGDTYYKCGIIKEITESGVLFLITSTNSNSYKEGKLHFISFSARLTFEVL